VSCPAAASNLAGGTGDTRCPFLQDALMQYCAAASVRKYIPACDALLPRCNSDDHLYCEPYLAHADPEGLRLPEPPAGSGRGPTAARPLTVDGIRVPSHLSYTPNHMWLDVAEDGHCHVGIDGFLAHVIGDVQKIGFVTSRTLDRPVAVLTVNGVDLQMVFPNPLQSTAANFYLRTNPAKLTADPYGAGWLFEGVEPTLSGAPVGAVMRAGLIPAENAVRWIYAESQRLSDWVHVRISEPSPAGSRLMADGGGAERGLASYLDRDGLIDLFSEFFSSHLAWRRSW
jgi:glycine cleavage system H lipoate-binding protein